MASRLIQKKVTVPNWTNTQAEITVYTVPIWKVFVPSNVFYWYKRTTISNWAILKDANFCSWWWVWDIKYEWTTDTIKNNIFSWWDVIKTYASVWANDANYTYEWGIVLMWEELDAG